MENKLRQVNVASNDQIITTTGEITLGKDKENTLKTPLTSVQQASSSKPQNQDSKMDDTSTLHDLPQKDTKEQKIYIPSELIKNSGFRSSSSDNPVYVEWIGLTYRVSEKIFKENTKNDQSFNEKFFVNQKNETRSWWRWWSKKPLRTLPMRLDEELLTGIGKVNGHKTIIENIHGCAGPGILAIMGPSGSGKTTLLNLLGDRVDKRGLEGSITLNGHKLSKDWKRHVAYCTQDDIFFPRLTVRQTLTYTALLRLPREMTRAEKLQQVENVLQLLNLTKCADTIIGDMGIRGISGGERKRVSIAGELLTDTSIILIDEPTSGLDSSLALELVKILKEFALRYRKTIIFVIHQPSSQVFDLFDQLLVLADGRMVYFDKAAELVNYLAQEEFRCHSNFNPADYILELLHNPVSRRKLINAYAHRLGSDRTGKDVVAKQRYRLRPQSLEPSLSEQNEKSDSLVVRPILVRHRWEATFKEQLMILTERAFKQRRNAILSNLDIGQMIALSIVVSVVWFRIPYEEDHIGDRIGSIYFMSVFWSFSSLIPTVSAFPIDRDVLSKERQARSYRLSAYFLGKTFAEVPLTIVCPAIFTVCTYWTTNLVPSISEFLAFWVVILLTVITSQSFGYLFGAMFLNVQKGMTTGTVFMLTTMLLAGFYVVYIPYWIKWFSYVSFSKYSFDLLMQIQFGTLVRYKCSRHMSGVSDYQECVGLAEGETDAYISGHSVLEHQKANNLPWYGNLLGLIGLCILARLAAYFVLRKTGGRRRS